MINQDDLSRELQNTELKSGRLLSRPVSCLKFSDSVTTLALRESATKRPAPGQLFVSDKFNLAR